METAFQARPHAEAIALIEGLAMNPDFVDMVRVADEQRAPEEKLVLEGGLLTKLREGTLAFDVKPDNRPGAYRFHPDHLTFSLKVLQNRYDAKIWSLFADTAQRTILENGVSIWEWVGGNILT